MFESLRDEWWTARSLQLCGKFHTLAGDFDRAEQVLNDAIARALVAKDAACQAAALNSLGVVENYRNRHDRAIAYEEQSAALYEGLNDEFGLALVTGNIADSALALGDYNHAAAMFRKSLSIYERGKNRFQIGLALANLGAAEVARERDDVALPLLLDALDIVEEYSDRWLLMIVLAHIARIQARRGEFERCAALLGAAASAQAGAGIQWSPSDSRDVEESEAAARSALGVSRFEEHFADGRQWPIELVIAEARAART